MLVTTGIGGLSFVQARHPAMLTGPIEPDMALPPGAAVLPDGRTVLLVTAHEQARVFLTDPRWSRAAAAGQQPVGPASAMSVTELDPPRHTFVRGVVSRMFSPRAVQQLRARIQRRAADLIDAMVAAGPPADLVSSFCAPFAFAVHCDLLGVPVRARETIRALSLARSGRPGMTAQETYNAEVALHRGVTEALNDIRRHGGDGILAELLAMREHAPLTGGELTGLASSLFFDGHLLASAQITSAVLSLLCHPGQLRLLAGDPRVLAPAVEELLRWSPSITLGMPRMASAPVDIGSRRMTPGQTAAVAFGLANRDDAVFDDPHRLDLSRDPNNHLSFGRGIHHCLGAYLMRLELDTALGALLHRLPNLALAVGERQLAWSASHTIRLLPQLPLKWTS